MGRTRPAPHQGSTIEPPMSAQEWVSQSRRYMDEFSLLFLISHVMTGYVVSEKTGSVFIRLRELSLKTTRCNTQLSCQCTMPGQRNRDNPVSRGAGEPAPNSEHVIAVESAHLFGDGMCEGELPSSSLHSSKPGEDGSADSGHKYMTAVSDIHQLQHSAKHVLNPSGTT